jgi:hypothetical protein
MKHNVAAYSTFSTMALTRELLTLDLLLLKGGLGVKLPIQAPAILIAGQYKVSARYRWTIISSEQAVILARVFKGRVYVL